MFTAVAQTQYVQFFAGALIGVLVGLFLGPPLRSWFAFREWVEASREADLTDRLLERFADADAPWDDASVAQHESTSDDPRGPEKQIGRSSATDAATKLSSRPRGVTRRAAKRSRE